MKLAFADMVEFCHFLGPQKTIQQKIEELDDVRKRKAEEALQCLLSLHGGGYAKFYRYFQEHLYSRGQGKKNGLLTTIEI